MSAKFKEGDVVVLKSGGPPMTITGKRLSDGDYMCKWFKGATAAQGYYSENILDPYVAPAKK